MSTATLVLDEPQKVTLEGTATNLREVVLPARTGSLLITCDEAIYLEIDSGQDDGDAGTAADQLKMRAGTYSWTPPYIGSIFLAATSASQEIWLLAQRERN